MTIKTTLKNIVYPGVVLAGLAGIVGSQFSCNSNVPERSTSLNKSYSSQASEYEPSKKGYTLEDFKRVLGKERLEGMSNDWSAFEDTEVQKDSSFKRLFTIYQNPEEYIKILNPKAREKYDKFNPEKNLNEYFTDSELEELQKKVPWRIVPKNKKFTESDKAMLFEIYSLKNFSIGPISFY